MNSFLDSHQPEAAQFVLARFLGRDASPHGNMGKREMLFLFHDSVANDKPARETASIDNHGGRSFARGPSFRRACAVSRMQRRLRRKNRTAAARHPYLGKRARCRAEEKGRHSESKREAGADCSGTGFFVSLWKSQAAIGATAGFAVLRRLMKTYPPMPTRSSSDAATWPGSGTAAGSPPPPELGPLTSEISKP